MNVLTEEDLVLITELLETLSVRVIAKKFECTVEEIRERLQLTPAFVSKASRIRKLYAEGKSRPECARIVGCGASLVLYALGSQNLEPVISVGKVYSKLTVIGIATPTKTRIKRYLCQCACGKTHIARHDLLVAAKTRSCGCAKGELKKLSIDIVNHNRHPKYSVKKSRVETDYNKVRECHRLYTMEKLTIHECLKRTGLTLSAYYRHRGAAVNFVV
jgi:hypothetical protein